MKRLLLLMFLVMGCELPSDPQDYACTANLVYGLVVTVNDIVGDEMCDATVEAVDGTHVELLEQHGCVYYGAGERAGSYQVTVEKAGYMGQTIDVKVERQDICHVKGETPSGWCRIVWP